VVHGSLITNFCALANCTQSCVCGVFVEGVDDVLMSTFGRAKVHALGELVDVGVVAFVGKEWGYFWWSTRRALL